MLLAYLLLVLMRPALLPASCAGNYMVSYVCDTNGAAATFDATLNVTVTGDNGCTNAASATNSLAAYGEPFVTVSANTVDRFCAADATSVTVTFTVNSDVPYHGDAWELYTEVEVLDGDTTPECMLVGNPTEVAPGVEGPIQNESQLLPKMINLGSLDELNSLSKDTNFKIAGKLLCALAQPCCP